jgi:hypothetical protein
LGKPAKNHSRFWFSPLFFCSKMAQKALTKSESRPSSYAFAQIQTCPAAVAGAFGPSVLVPHSEKCIYVARPGAHSTFIARASKSDSFANKVSPAQSVAFLCLQSSDTSARATLNEVRQRRPTWGPHPPPPC